MIRSVSVDLDGLGCYAAIHGLSPSLDDRALRAVPEVALQRFCELFSSAGVRATFFVIGREAGLAPSPLRNAAVEGHEIALHSYAHDYALSRRTREEIAQDLALAERAIEDASGQRPRGFALRGTRSPRRCSTPSASAVRVRLFPLPSVPYYVAKAAAIGLYALRGRRQPDIPRRGPAAFCAAGRAWAPGRPRAPIATLPGLRAPVIGTTVLPFPALARAAFAGGHFNLELHGIDALDQSDVPREIARAQPGMRTPAAQKLRRLRGLLNGSRETTARFRTRPSASCPDRARR